MAPGDAAHVPRTPSPVAEAGPVAEHFRSRARLRRLLVRLRRPTPSTPALRATPGGLRSLRSASSLPFLVILLLQNNALTFVRGACRACCAPRKGYCGFICAPRKWLCRPTNALPVLGRTPPEGHWRAHPAAAPCRPAVTSKQTRTPFQSASAAAQWTPPSPRRSAGAAPKRRHGPFRGGEPPPWSAAARIEYPHNPRRIPPR